MSYANKKERTLISIGLAIFTTGLARIIGFVRELYLAKVFGTSALGDAFIVAFSIPDILVSGFATAILTLYIPTYFKIKNDTNDAGKIKEYNFSIITFMLTIAVIVIVITESFPKAIVTIFASGFSEETFAITIKLLRIMIFAVVPIFIGGLFMAYGQIVHCYPLFIFLGCINNLSIIIALIIFRDNNIAAIAWSALIGNIINNFILLLIIIKKNFKIQKALFWKNKYLHGLILGIIPVFISNIILEVNQIIDKNFASHLMEGTVAALNYSSKIINLITAILGTAVSNVLFSQLSQAASEGKKKELSNKVLSINAYVLAMVMPVFYLVVFHTVPIVHILFERGSFDSKSVSLTADCLFYYSLGIIGSNLKTIWIKVYNASMDTKTPAVNSVIAIIFNILFNLLFVHFLKHKGLALATGMSSLLTSMLLLTRYHRINTYFHSKNLFIEFSKMIIASMCYIPFYVFGRNFKIDGIILIIITKMLLPFIIGSICYIIILIKMNSLVGIKILDLWRHKYDKKKIFRL